MGEKQQQPKQSFIKRTFKFLLKLVLFLVAFTVVVMPIIYLYGSQRIHEYDSHPLYDVFFTEPYAKLQKMLDRNQHVLLYGTKEAGIQHFLIHYANRKTEAGSQVVMRPLTSDDDMELESILTKVRHFYEDHLNIVEQEPTIWILLTEDNQIPGLQFEQISSRYPKDKFIIVTDTKIQFKDFRVLAFIPIDEADFKEQIMHSFDVDLKTAQILFKYYQTIPNLINRVQTSEFSPQSLLGEDYHQANNLTIDDKHILYELCVNGRVSGKVEHQTLEQFGTIFFEGSYYWVNHPSRLNYELHSGLMCKPSLMSKSVKNRMIKQEEEERRKAQQQAKAMKQQEEKRRKQVEEKAEKFRKRTQQV